MDKILSEHQVARFHEEGYIVIPRLLKDHQLQIMLDAASAALASAQSPKELEASLGYPGAPKNLQAEGGDTLRRLLNAYDRDSLWRDWATHPTINAVLKQLFDGEKIVLSLAHHNCIMTKQSRFSSDTGWHQDIRYWSFKRAELISTWLALGSETAVNGGLRVVPGSHREDYRPQQFDEGSFFRQDLAENRRILARAVDVELDAGDTLFFHCRLLHSASRNQTDRVKLSLVYTYSEASNPPIANTRSAGVAGISIN